MESQYVITLYHSEFKFSSSIIKKIDVSNNSANQHLINIASLKTQIDVRDTIIREPKLFAKTIETVFIVAVEHDIIKIST